MVKKVLSLVIMLVIVFSFVACGVKGKDGTNGKNAYEIWLETGHTGSQADFLQWLKGENGSNGNDGENGDDGLSAYEIYKKYYEYDGTEKEWIDDLISGKLDKLDMSRVEDIRIDISKIKTRYKMNESLELNGLIVKALIGDDNFKILNDDEYYIDVSEYDKTTAGVYRVRISCGEHKANFFVTNSITFDKKGGFWDGQAYTVLIIMSLGFM